MHIFSWGARTSDPVWSFHPVKEPTSQTAANPCNGTGFRRKGHLAQPRHHITLLQLLLLPHPINKTWYWMGMSSFWKKSYSKRICKLKVQNTYWAWILEQKHKCKAARSLRKEVKRDRGAKARPELPVDSRFRHAQRLQSQMMVCKCHLGPLLLL